MQFSTIPPAVKLSFKQLLYSHTLRHEFLITGVKIVMESSPASVVRSFLRDSYEFAMKEIHSFVLPINNFLKDMTQMEQDFQDSSAVVSISEAVLSATTMEENY